MIVAARPGGTSPCVDEFPVAPCCEMYASSAGSPGDGRRSNSCSSRNALEQPRTAFSLMARRGADPKASPGSGMRGMGHWPSRNIHGADLASSLSVSRCRSCWNWPPVGRRPFLVGAVERKATGKPVAGEFFRPRSCRGHDLHMIPLVARGLPGPDDPRDPGRNLLSIREVCRGRRAS